MKTKCKNLILSNLPKEEYELLAPHLQEVALEAGETLYEVHTGIEHVYFPTGAVASILACLEDGSAIEAAMVGCKGVIGVQALWQDGRVPYRVVNEIPGEALKIRAAALRDLAKAGTKLQDMIFGYTHVLFTHVAQTAACNRVHPVEGRLARWLLMAQDNLGANDFKITHDAMARLLGTRRAGITVAAGKLQERGAIRYSRGRVAILSRQKMKSITCECYEVIEQEYRRIAQAGSSGRRLN